MRIPYTPYSIYLRTIYRYIPLQLSLWLQPKLPGTKERSQKLTFLFLGHLGAYVKIEGWKGLGMWYTGKQQKLQGVEGKSCGLGMGNQGQTSGGGHFGRENSSTATLEGLRKCPCQRDHAILKTFSLLLRLSALPFHDYEGGSSSPTYVHANYES